MLIKIFYVGRTLSKISYELLYSILNNQPNIIFLTDGSSIKLANKKFIDYFKCSSLEDLEKSSNANCFKLKNAIHSNSSIVELLDDDGNTKIFKADFSSLDGDTLVTLNDISSELEKHSLGLQKIIRRHDDFLITSETDLKGIITKVNKNFCLVSGYSADELIGKAHNIVRHEDMPKSAFKICGKNLKQVKCGRVKLKIEGKMEVTIG